MRSSNSASSLCIRSHITQWPLKRYIRHSVVQELVHQITCIEHLLIESWDIRVVMTQSGCRKKTLSQCGQTKSQRGKFHWQTFYTFSNSDTV